ncbi:Nramp family divalent metal transporter [Flagellimonas allohymeniacidonis]|uniref:Divalent metal cation transporter n=1 Tax=Flagellimonas allohymeniacidonis TaxID=2517819 RepID=A0A4Q8QI87_9FLAO|nr:Nramp family divalent metal transporter [Allomuricauda hymeniacidonis]TAI48958.1 divalent metal cation transporter [Allomuricauda hymeniacidonis]
MLKKIGPGILVAAAFVGPGTITVCTIAGVGFGFALIWAVLVSILATIILQEMAGRIGFLAQTGLVDVVKGQLRNIWLRNSVIGVVLAAILVGNAAYEAGNIGGATLGLEGVFGNTPFSFFYPLLIGLLAFAILWWGNYKSLERIFIALVGLMGLCFIISAIITKPSIFEILKGAFVPTLPQDSILTVMALVGTTVVPYNLFLHAALVKEKWGASGNLSTIRWDTIVSIAIGGAVSIAILITASASQIDNVTNIMDLAKGVEPLFGKMAVYFMVIGLFCAGVTSAMTAPLAAAYVANSCFGWRGTKDIRFRMVWIAILFLGVLFLSFDIKPIQIIQFAQVANGILLPVMAILLLWIANKKNVMGAHSNSLVQNLLGVIIIGFTIFLGVKSILKVFELL